MTPVGCPMADLKSRIVSSGFRGELRLGEPMSNRTTFKIGGPADVFAVPADEADLAVLAREAREAGLPVLVVGDGSNLLVRDGGIRGVVVSLARFDGIEPLSPRGAFRAGAGVKYQKLAYRMAEEGFAGLEFAVRIPGTVGGALVMNAGTPEGELKDVLLAAAFIFPDGSRRILLKEDLGLGYRSSRLPAGGIATTIDVLLSKGDPDEIRGRMNWLASERRSKQPQGVPSAGSIYKNPPGDFAGRLIEAAGIKGRRAGGAEVSSVHANFIVNAGGARAADVLALMDAIERAAAERFGVRLEREIRVVGEG